MNNPYQNYGKQPSKDNCTEPAYLGKKRIDPENPSSSAREGKKRAEYDDKYGKYDKYSDKYDKYSDKYDRYDKYESSHQIASYSQSKDFSRYSSSNKGNRRNSSSKYQRRDNYDMTNPGYYQKYHGQNLRGKSPIKESYRKYGDQSYKKNYSAFNDDEGVRNLSQCEIPSPLQNKVSEVNSLIQPNSAKSFNLVQGINNFVSNIVSSQFQAKPGTFQNIFQNQPNINIKINLTSTPSQLALCTQARPAIQEPFHPTLLHPDVQHDINSMAIVTIPVSSSSSLPLMRNVNLSNKPNEGKITNSNSISKSSLLPSATSPKIEINNQKEIAAEKPIYFNPLEFDPIPVRTFLEQIKNDNESKIGIYSTAQGIQEPVKFEKNALLAFVFEKSLENKKLIEKFVSSINVDECIKEREAFSKYFKICEDIEMKGDKSEIKTQRDATANASANANANSSHYFIFDEKFKLPTEKLTNDQTSKKIRTEIGHIKKKSEKEITERKFLKDKVYRLQNKIKLLKLKQDEIQSKLEEIFSEY